MNQYSRFKTSILLLLLSTANCLLSQTQVDYSLGTPINPVTIELTICPGEEIQFNHVGYDGTLNYMWSSTPEDNNLLCPLPFDNDCHNPSSSPEVSTIYEVSACIPGNEENITKATIKIYVLSLIVHPIDEDFVAGKEGRVMISTYLDDDYYTEEITTVENEVAQKDDGVVRITVHITPPEAGVGKTVYFRVVEPDPDDLSTYEKNSGGTLNTDPGDNSHPSPGTSGILSNQSGQTGTGVDVQATLETINGVQVAAAEVELQITNKYSGDNYQVEASLDPDFPLGCKTGKTVTLVAWKRAYVEYDRMYKKGATLVHGFTPDDNTLDDDEIFVDNVSDFSEGDVIQIITPTNSAGPTVTVMDVNVVLNRLKVTDMPYTLTALQTGFKIEGQDEYYEATTTLTETAFGGNTSGLDGGVFIEFKWLSTGLDFTPKYTFFPFLETDPESHFYGYTGYWFDQRASGNCNQSNGTCRNAIYLIAAADMAPDPDGKIYGGVTAHNTNVSALFLENLGDGSSVNEDVVHEFGHQIGLYNGFNGHIDLEIATPNHDGSDSCLMSYKNDRDNGKAEFDSFHEGCIYDLRRHKDPF